MEPNILYGILVSASGIWSITTSFIMSTRNTSSALIFKVIPFFMGMGCLYVGANLFGILG